jgi:hypothetical protein
MGERRTKIFLMFDRQMLFNCGWTPNDSPDCFTISTRPIIPDGARVLAVEHSLSRACFAFLVEHDSFPVVPDGAESPLAENPFESRNIVAVKEEDGRYRIGSIDEVLP